MMVIFVTVPHKGATGATPENHENFAAGKIATKAPRHKGSPRGLLLKNLWGAAFW